jgi:hypothetical protein
MNIIFLSIYFPTNLGGIAYNVPAVYDVLAGATAWEGAKRLT